MKLRVILLIACFCIYLSGTDQAQNDTAQSISSSQPGPEHQLLGKLVGTWKAQCEFWNEPDVSPVIEEGTATNSVILNGLFLQQEFNGNLNGRKFVGMSIYGFDRVHENFTITSFSNSISTVSSLSGKVNSDNTVISFSGEVADPEVSSPLPVRAVVTLLDPNSYVYEMFMKLNGKEFKCTELKFKRIK